MIIDTKGVVFEPLNAEIAGLPSGSIAELHNVLGQRYIGSGTSGKEICIHGTPGNALGSYLNGSNITVYGNAQDATGDTMNAGSIVIHGSCGDTTGYAMRGGSIYIKGNAGYRVGIHMKEYHEHKPVIVIGGSVGDFLGEYQAGGVIIVLGLGCGEFPVGSYCGTGMHGGNIYIRSEKPPWGLPRQVAVRELEDPSEIGLYLDSYCAFFGCDKQLVYRSRFYRLSPNSNSPYKRLYTHV